MPDSFECETSDDFGEVVLLKSLTADRQKCFKYFLTPLSVH